MQVHTETHRPQHWIETSPRVRAQVKAIEDADWLDPDCEDLPDWFEIEGQVS